MAEPLVVVDGVWKKFRRGERSDGPLDLGAGAVSALIGSRRESSALADREFWAVRDMSFAIGPGEAVSVIGPNGAGKSTLLKLLTRSLSPTRGYCRVRGRVGALVDGAARFDPDLTGRENVFLRGAIMGLERADIARKFDDIAAFSGINDFIETPVSRYSSGMSARLGFAIAAHLDPDVLLIDEGLSAGDAEFHEQCRTRMRQLVALGVPVVVVSRDLPGMFEPCTRTLVIDQGSVKFDGDPRTALAEYRRTTVGCQARPSHTPPGPIQIGAVQLLDETGEATVFRTNGPMTVRISYHVIEPVDEPHFAIDIYRADGVFCAGVNTRMDQRTFGTVDCGGAVDLSLPNLSLLPGCYVVSVGILNAKGAQTLDVHHRAYPFTVASPCRDLGLVKLSRTWRHWPHGVAASHDAPSSSVVRQFRRVGAVSKHEGRS